MAIADGIAGTGGTVYLADTGNNRILKFSVPAITVFSPDGGQNWTRGSARVIRWNYTGKPGTRVQIVLLRNGIPNRVINASTPIGSGGIGLFTWPVPFNQTPATNYRIRIRSTANITWNDTSNADFSISAGAPFTVTVPNGGQNWKQGTSQIIQWGYAGSPGSRVRIELIKGTTVNRIVNASIARI